MDGADFFPPLLLGYNFLTKREVISSPDQRRPRRNVSFAAYKMEGIAPNAQTLPLQHAAWVGGGGPGPLDTQAHPHPSRDDA